MEHIHKYVGHVDAHEAELAVGALEGEGSAKSIDMNLVLLTRWVSQRPWTGGEYLEPMHIYRVYIKAMPCMHACQVLTDHDGNKRGFYVKGPLFARYQS